MSTFDGFIKEFPDITVDHFTLKPHRPTPRAAFLSHVHSDHMTGLSTYSSSFVYCTAATKQLVLRLQTKRDRQNLAAGLIERKLYIYGNLSYRKDLLKPLPLNTPTIIPIGDSVIRVTLLDANHCPGSCMFLLEREGVSVLYTGDIRAESSWIQKLSSSPVLAPYLSGMRRIDYLYLDTTFASTHEATREFLDRSSAIHELIQSMSEYPKSTVFHFNAWTFGYEELWVAVAASFGYKVHVDRYRMELYGSIKSADIWEWGPLLGGHVDRSQKKSGVADYWYQSYLTEDPETTFHSCDSRGVCPVRDNANVVQIIPITTRRVIWEDQATQTGDLNTKDNLESSPSTKTLKRKCRKNQEPERNPKRTKTLILKEAGHTLLEPKKNWWVNEASKERPLLFSATGESLPYFISVPLSRHSSLNELRRLVQLFKPRDLYPCVEDPDKLTYLDLEGCFGDLCDLSESAYLKQKGMIVKVDPDAAIQKMLQERWSYDDLDEDEDEGVEDGTNSAEDTGQEHSKFQSRNSSYSIVNELFNHRNRSSNLGAVRKESHESDPAGDTDEEERVESRSSSQLWSHRGNDHEAGHGADHESLLSSQDIIFRDDQVADAELVEYFYQVASKGGNINLKSVGGEFKEDVL